MQKEVKRKSDQLCNNNSFQSLNDWIRGHFFTCVCFPCDNPIYLLQNIKWIQKNKHFILQLLCKEGEMSQGTVRTERHGDVTRSSSWSFPPPSRWTIPLPGPRCRGRSFRRRSDGGRCRGRWGRRRRTAGCRCHGECPAEDGGGSGRGGEGGRRRRREKVNGMLRPKHDFFQLLSSRFLEPLPFMKAVWLWHTAAPHTHSGYRR